MSIETTYRCDHCKGPITPGGAALRFDAHGISLNNRAVSLNDIHVCGACVPKVAEFFGNRPREHFGIVIMCDDIIGMHSTGRVQPQQTIKMTASIPTRHGQLLMSQDERDRHETAVSVLGAFQPQRIVLERGSDWAINDIQSGNRSEFAQAGEIPGDMFASDTVDNTVSFSVVPPGAKFAILATYIGKNPEGAHFDAKVYCRVQGEEMPPGERFVINGEPIDIKRKPAKS